MQINYAADDTSFRTLRELNTSLSGKLNNVIQDFNRLKRSVNETEFRQQNRFADVQYQVSSLSWILFSK